MERRPSQLGERCVEERGVEPTRFCFWDIDLKSYGCDGSEADIQHLHILMLVSFSSSSSYTVSLSDPFTKCVYMVIGLGSRASGRALEPNPIDPFSNQQRKPFAT